MKVTTVYGEGVPAFLKPIQENRKPPIYGDRHCSWSASPLATGQRFLKTYYVCAGKSGKCVHDARADHLECGGALSETPGIGGRASPAASA